MRRGGAGGGGLVGRGGGGAGVGVVLGSALAAVGLPGRGPPYPHSFGPAAGPPPAGLAVATFAGGCFWCMEPPFDALEGVVSTTSGYTGGRAERPSYVQVGAGGTGHLEAVRVVFDPSKVSYERLLDVFWHNIDPLDAG